MVEICILVYIDEIITLKIFNSRYDNFVKDIMLKLLIGNLCIMLRRNDNSVYGRNIKLASCVFIIRDSHLSLRIRT